MKIELISSQSIYTNPSPAARSRQALFPGVIKLPNGELLAMFSIAEAFEAANNRTYVSRSGDLGKTWSLPIVLYDQEKMRIPCQLSDYYKPCMLANGNIIAAGYGFYRENPDESISDIANITGELPNGVNLISFSNDNGHTWSIPQKMELGLERGLELSGPAIQLNDGRIVIAASEFSLKAEKQVGYSFASKDNGISWYRQGIFFQHPPIAAWEVRICELEYNKIGLILWAHDLSKEQNLPNHFITSDDGGITWNAPINTGIRGQASNLFYLGNNQLLTVHAHREKDAPGIYIRHVDISNNQFKVLAEKNIWNGLCNHEGSITEQFENLKFGQPSLLKLPDDEFLVIHWCWEKTMFVIKSHLIKIG
jgi:sialidase-1